MMPEKVTRREVLIGAASVAAVAALLVPIVGPGADRWRRFDPRRRNSLTYRRGISREGRHSD